MKNTTDFHLKILSFQLSLRNKLTRVKLKVKNSLFDCCGMKELSTGVVIITDVVDDGVAWRLP